MNTNFTRFLFFIFCSFYLLPFSANAQQWRWGKKGGSADDVGGRYEHVVDMATDADGNVYTIATVYQGAMNVNNVPRTGWGNSDVMLASFSCDGTLRWSKILGSGGGGDMAMALTLSKDGGVYLSAVLSTNQGTVDIHIDADATITMPAGDWKSLYLVKYNTDGNLQWFRAPQADTVSMYSYTNVAAIEMLVDEQDNVHMLCKLPQGEYGGPGGYVVNTLGEYILKYDAAGNFIGGIDLNMKIEGTSVKDVHMVKNKRNGNYYLGGTIGIIDQVKINGTVLTGYSYLTCFNDQGQLQWLKESTGTGGGISSFTIDNSNSNIYVSGGGDDNVSFAGYTVENRSSPYTRPFVAMYDSVCNLIWGSTAYAGGAATGATNIAIRNSGEVIAILNYAGSISWPGRPETFTSGAYSTALARFAKNGKLLELINLVSNNGSATADKIVTDGKDNIFIGGDFAAEINVNGQNLYSTGGEADWWIAKYGYDCNCADIPEPGFAFTRNGYDLAFNYTGSSNYTGIEWDFGDGTTSTDANPSHTYPANSYQTVCVKVANNCGDNIYCENIPLWPTGVPTVTAQNGISLYPNPASDFLTIDGITNATMIHISDMTGRKLLHCPVTGHTSTIDISSLSAGAYIVQLSETGGTRMAIFVK